MFLVEESLLPPQSQMESLCGCGGGQRRCDAHLAVLLELQDVGDGLLWDAAAGARPVQREPAAARPLELRGGGQLGLAARGVEGHL